MAALRIEDGAAHLWFAYDVGQQIDLDEAQRRCRVRTEREQIRHQKRAPSYLQFQPPPLKLDEECPPVAIAGFSTDGTVESTLFDFGAVSIAYRIPIAGHALEELRALAQALDENAQLLTDSQRRVRELADRLGDAVLQPKLADLVEDYVVFHVRRWTPDCDPARVVDENRTLVARTLRSEPDELREGEVVDALQFRIAYGPRDDLVIDWNGALLFEPHGEDTLAVLEFANVELLEMRFLDDRLDEALDRSHEVLRARSGIRLGRRHRRRDTRSSMRRIANLQIDGAVLFESVNNAIKLLGDQFLARVYRQAARRFHLAEWDASILRKLQTLESIYEKLSDEQATRRMETLEWIVIVLIVIEILLPFVIAAWH